MKPVIAIYLIWSAWFVTWIAGAILTPPAVRRASLPLELLYRVLVIGGYALLFGLYNRYDTEYRLWNAEMGQTGWTLAWVVIGAVLFCWWTRAQLGFQLPGTGRRKPRLVMTGPYRAIRHPFYTGVIVAAVATAAALGAPSAAAGAIVLFAAFVMKAILEEIALRRELGPDAYAAYARRVPVLVPLRRSQIWFLPQDETPRKEPVMTEPAVTTAEPAVTGAAAAEPGADGTTRDLFNEPVAETPAPAKPARPAPGPQKDPDEETLDLFAAPFADDGADEEEDAVQPSLRDAVTAAKQ